MNRLKRALGDPSNVALDFYLEDISTIDFRNEVEALINSAVVSTPQGELKAQILKVLMNA